MNDKELADKAYRLLGRRTPASHKCGHHSWHVYTWGLDANQYVRDWRVAGALMEKCVQELGSIGFLALTLHGFHPVVTESLPRAIIEACVEALSADRARREDKPVWFSDNPYEAQMLDSLEMEKQKDES